MLLVQGMFPNAGCDVSVGESYSQEFKVKIRVHKDSVLSSLLFISVLEGLFIRVSLWSSMGKPLCR